MSSFFEDLPIWLRVVFGLQIALGLSLLGFFIWAIIKLLQHWSII